LDNVAAPMVAGIYGADPWDLSLEATLPQFLRMEREHGSVVRAIARGAHRPGSTATRGTSGPRYGLFATLRGGMERLVEALRARLPVLSVCTGSRVDRIARDGEEWLVHVAGGQPIRADGVCLALPAWAASSLLRPHDAALADLLDGIPYGSSATVNLAYAASAHPLDGMGFVVPAAEGRSFIGVSFSSVKFDGRAPDGTVLLRAFVGGPLASPRLAEGDEALAHSVDADLRSVLGIAAPPLLAQVHRHPRSLPQYRVGHLARAEEIRRRVAALGGLAVAGNLLGGVGIPDCVASAERAAVQLVHSLA
ncbi:MAG: protoporphyrinogen oxidase, partial [Planctomycetes bacterium]|nr:protoporphyrinogen oxidase [Planctomycetota bacterium]